MKRRNFVAFVASAALVPVVGSSQGAEPIEIKVYGDVVEAKGKPEDLRELAEDFQTSLWPDWRTHENAAARGAMKRAEQSIQQGSLLFAYGCRITRVAFNETLLNLKKPWVIV